MGRTDPLPPYSASPAPIASSSFASFSSFNSSSSSSSISYDPFVDLGRLLSRLEKNLLRADSDRWRRLVADEFQRLQARFDVAAARKLLTRVEQSALSIKVLTRKQEVQAELNRRRVLIDLLQERLDNLDEEARAAAAFDKDSGGDAEEEADDVEKDGDDEVLAHIIRAQSGNTQQPAVAETTNQPEPAQQEPAPAEQTNPKRKKTNRVRITVPGEEASTATDQPQPTSTATETAPTTTMTTRSRKRRQQASASSGTEPEDAAHSTSAQVTSGDSSQTAAAASLFGQSSEGGAATGVASEEAVLDHHRREQEALSEDILRLAKALKEKSLTTSRMLEDDKDVVDRVGEGMNTTTDSLSAASRSMAVLSRMTEGKGWWGRLLLLGMVYGSMAVLVLLFLFLPKLRL